MDELISLSNQALSDLNVDRPHYDRTSLTPGIVHIGVGNFHRAHQAWYLHRLMQQGLAQDWAIVGAGVRSYDADMRDKLLQQDCLTTLIELDPAGMSAEVTGAMIDYLPVEDNNETLITKMADPAIRIVSLTVTEGGYFIDPATGTPDVSHPDLAFDIANPDAPKSAFGAIVRALGLRRTAGHAPFTVQSCDNLSGNGDITRRLVVDLAKEIDPDLAAWISEQGAFPNSMVDCIVPATSDREIKHAHRFGIKDAVPVTHENFRQWVVEDRFCAGRPEWEKVGAILTDDVHIYEAMKLRILNAGHQVLANAGELLAVETIAGCMSHNTIRAFFAKVQTTQIVPTVQPVPGMTPNAYVKLIEQRFSNVEIHDTTRRVAFDGSSRHPGFVVPILRDLLAQGRDVSGLCLVEALWARMCLGKREDGSYIEPNDPFWGDLAQTAELALKAPKRWLQQDTIYGDLVENPDVVEQFSYWFERLGSDGCDATLGGYINDEGVLKTHSTFEQAALD